MRIRATLGLMATAIVYAFPAVAEDAADDQEGPDMEVYGTLIPFLENVGTSGATPLGTMSQAYQVANGNYTGINHPRRFRLTAGTSNIGFRGDWEIAGDDFGLIWQVESPAPIDGEGPSNWANRNSHLGFTGRWGTLVYGNWDTPMRWVSVTSVNPIKAGYVGDGTAIIGSPGHSIPAWNGDQTLTALFEIPPNRAGFFRHEANSIQYWSPDLAGFSLRAMYAVNEHRLAGIPSPAPGVPATEPAMNPYLLSGSIGYDTSWLRLRYAAELHNDYFGMQNLVGQGSTLQSRSSTDTGHLALVSVKINAQTDYETRVVLTGDMLSYHTDVAPGIASYTDEFSREAIYGLVQQKFGGHNVWAAYGQATEGKCHVTGVGNENLCTTTGLGAKYYTLAYMYEFTESTGIYALGYLLANDVSARYTPFPLLESDTNNDPSLPNFSQVSHGSDVLGVGIGFVHRFSAEVWGNDEAKRREPAPPPERAAAPPEPAEAEFSTDAAATTDTSPSAAEPGAESEPAEPPVE